MGSEQRDCLRRDGALALLASVEFRFDFLTTVARGLNAKRRFAEITADSFHWIGEVRPFESEPWQVAWKI